MHGKNEKIVDDNKLLPFQLSLFIFVLWFICIVFSTHMLSI